MPIAEKEFVLKHVIEDVWRMNEDENNYSNTENHFGVPWRIIFKCNYSHLGLYLECEKEITDRDWSIEFFCEMKIRSVEGEWFSRSAESIVRNEDEWPGWGTPYFITLDEMFEDYVDDDNLNVEIHVKIKKMTGIEKKNLRNFDESNKQFSDVVLVVENQKFYVSKLFLAGQSPYFNALLRGNFKESEKGEVTLKDVDAEDFQNFLESLHSEPSINDDTVTGILHLADMYDTKTVMRLCQEFLMEKSTKSTKEKLDLAAKYKFENLKNKCLLEINTIDDIRSVLAGDLSKMDPTVLASLLQKSVPYQT